MADISDDQLKHEVKTVFNRSLNEDQVAAYRGRLPVMLNNARLIRQWAARLGLQEPALIQRPQGGHGGDGADEG